MTRFRETGRDGEGALGYIEGCTNANKKGRTPSEAVLGPLSSLMTYGILRGIRYRPERLVQAATDATGRDPNQTW